MCSYVVVIIVSHETLKFFAHFTVIKNKLCLNKHLFSYIIAFCMHFINTHNAL